MHRIIVRETVYRVIVHFFVSWWTMLWIDHGYWTWIPWKWCRDHASFSSMVNLVVWPKNEMIGDPLACCRISFVMQFLNKGNFFVVSRMREISEQHIPEWNLLITSYITLSLTSDVLMHILSRKKTNICSKVFYIYCIIPTIEWIALSQTNIV